MVTNEKRSCPVDQPCNCIYTDRANVILSFLSEQHSKVVVVVRKGGVMHQRKSGVGKALHSCRFTGLDSAYRPEVQDYPSSKSGVRKR